ncbi:MAG: MOSC domain-containing protein [Sandaracinaceae bacterium]
MRVTQVFVGRPQELTFRGDTVMSSIAKDPVTGPVRVHRLSLEGDAAADLTVHGGIDKAVYVYPREHYALWAKEHPDLTFFPGVFGENLSTEGLLEPGVCIGDRFRIGSATFAVTSPRMPCRKLGMRMGDPTFVRAFFRALRNGFYLRVVEEGTLRPGDPVEPLGGDGHGLSVHEVARLYGADRSDRDLWAKAVASPSLPADWREHFLEREPTGG